MNFLELAQRLRAECSIQGNGPSSVLNQTSIEAKLVNWIHEAYNEIQAMPFSWKWQREIVQLPLVAGQFDYPLGATPWNRPDIRAFEPQHAIVLRIDGTFERALPMSIDDFIACYPVIGNIASTNPPTCFAILPNDVVRFNVKPDQAYTLQAVAKLAPQSLTQNADAPRMPAEFHLAIVYSAKMKYALHDGDSALYNGAKAEYDSVFRDLVAAMVPAFQYRATPLVR